MDVRLPDGRILRNVPDGTSKAELREKLARNGVAEPGGKSFFPATVSLATGIAQGAAGMADLVSMAPRYGLAQGLDWAQRGVNAVAGGEGRGALNKAADFIREGDAARIEKLIPLPADQQMVRRVGEGVGGALTGAGLAGAAARGGAGRFLSSLAAAPATQAVAGGAGGGAAEGVRQGGGSVPMQVAAALAAGLLSPGSIEGVLARRASLASRGRSAVPIAATLAAAPFQAAARMRTSGFVDEGAASILREKAVDPVAAAARLNAAQPSVSGASLTTAELAGDEGLAGLQRSVGNIEGGTVTRQNNNAVLRANAINETFGEGDTSALSAAADRQSARLGEEVDTAVGAVGDLAPADVSGDEIRAALAARDKEAKARASALYDLPGGDDPVQVGAFQPNFVDDLPAGPSDDTLRRESFMASGKASQKPVAEPRTKGIYSLIAGRGVNINGELASELRAAGYGPRDLPGLFRTSGGVSSADELIVPAREAGFIPQVGEGVDNFSGADFSDMLLNDIRAAGKSGTGARVTVAEEQAAGDAARDAKSNQDWWDREFSDRKLDPKAMTADDWDGMYRDVEGIDAPAVTQGDVERSARGATLSPLQASLVSLQRGILGEQGATGAASLQVKRILNADVKTVREVEDVVRRLRGAAGMAQGEQRYFAGSAASAIEGWLQSVAPEFRREGMKAARKGWSAYKGQFGDNEAGKILKESYGRPVLDSARVPAVAVPADRMGAPAVRRLAENVGPEVATKAVREEVRRALDAAGNSSTAIARVAKRYGPAMSAAPDVAFDVKRAQEAAAMAEAFELSPLGLTRDRSKDASARVAAALSANDKGKALLSMRRAVAGDAEAEAGLRRALAEYVVPSKVTTVTADGSYAQRNASMLEGLEKVIAKTEMAGLFDAKQMKALKGLRDELKAQQFAISAEKPAGSNTSRDLSLKRAMGKLALDAVGGAKLNWVRSVVAALSRADEIGGVVQAAMLDPKLAAQLLQADPPARAAALVKQVRSSMLGGAYAGAAARDYSPARM